MNSMDDTTANNGDEAEDPVSHLQEVVDDVDLDSATEEDPLTLDPSTSLLQNPLLPLADILYLMRVPLQPRTLPSPASAKYPP